VESATPGSTPAERDAMSAASSSARHRVKRRRMLGGLLAPASGLRHRRLFPLLRSLGRSRRHTDKDNWKKAHGSSTRTAGHQGQRARSRGIQTCSRGERLHERAGRRPDRPHQGRHLAIVTMPGARLARPLRGYSKCARRRCPVGSTSSSCSSRVPCHSRCSTHQRRGAKFGPPEAAPQLPLQITLMLPRCPGWLRSAVGLLLERNSDEHI